MDWAKGALDLLFPPRCPFCQRLLEEEEQLLCADCQNKLPWTFGRQGERAGEFFELCAAPLWYRDRVREAFHRYKFSGCQWYAKPFGTLMAQCAADRLAGRYDLITWAPLSWWRRWRRGYDQAQLLAREMGRILGLWPVPLLRKVRHTRPQSGLEDDAQRRANALDAYSLLPGAQVSGRRVLLVDDIITTGSTLSECARVLRTAGSGEVVCMTLAIARADK